MRRPSLSDRRAILVELSERGRAFLPELKAVWRQLAIQCVAGLSTTSVDHLVDVLSDLAASLDTVHSPGIDPANEPPPALPQRVERLSGRKTIPPRSA